MTSSASPLNGPDGGSKMVKAPPPAGVDASAAPASAGLKSTEPARGDQTAAGPEHAMAKDSLPRDDAPRAAGPEDPTAPPRHSSDLTPPPPSPAVEQRAKPSRRDDDADTKEAESSPRMKIGHRRPRVPGYEILDVLGDGGMGVVYKARQRYPERIVALKMIRAGEIASPSILARFETEINAVAKLHHANIVQLYEIGECDGLPFFTMEYLEGGSLHDMLPKRRHTPHEAAALVELLARAVHYAHERGIVHRDLKPGNVLLTAAGELKISDFGLAKVLGGSSHPAVTISGTPMGTPEYMSPEQAAGAKEIGPASDVYSLGVMLYELLTGQRPFHGDNVLDKVRTEEAPSPAWATSVPRDLETICLKCLRKEPKQRYATALELADDLRRFAEGKPITGQRPSLLRRLRHQIKHRPRRAAGVALALALVAGALGAWAWGDAYYFEHYEHYADYTKHHGVPVGIHRLSDDDLAHRPASLRFVRRGRRGRLERVDIVNSQGNLTWNHTIGLWIPGVRSALARNTRECSYHFEYDPQGRAVAEIGYDITGQPVWRFQYDYQPAPDEQGNTLVVARAVEPSAAEFGTVVSDAAGVGTVRFVRDRRGYDVSMHFYDAGGKSPRRSAVTDDDHFMQGVFGARFDWNKSGRVDRVRFTDDKDRPMANRYGVFQIHLKHNPAGDVEQQAHFGADGKQPLLDKSGVHRVVSQHDGHGYQKYVADFGIGRDYANSEWGIAILTTHYDPLAKVMRSEGLNWRQKRVAVMETTFRDDGNPATSVTTLIGPAGVESKIQWEYDDIGNVRVERNFGRGGATLTRTVENTFHPRTNHKVSSIERNPASGKGLLTRWTHAPGRLEERRFDPGAREDEKDDRLLGVTIKKYDNTGRLHLETQQDGHEETLKETTYEYYPDSDRVLTTTEKFEKDGKPVVRVATWTYNERGDVGTVTYTDGEGNPGRSDEGYQRQENFYAVHGALERTVYSGYSAEERSYTGRVVHHLRGRISAVDFLDAADEPQRGREGYSKIVYEFDDYDKDFKRTYSGYDGSLGFAQRVETEDWQRNATVESYLDQGKPVRHGQGHLTKTDFWDAQRSVVVKRVSEGYAPPLPYVSYVDLFDAQGRPVAYEYRDTRGELVNGPDGIAHVAIIYSADGRRRTERFEDADGQPAHLQPSGHSQAEYEFDADRRISLARFFGFRPGSPWESRTHRADAAGRAVEMAYRDVDGKLVSCGRGFARVTCDYSEGRLPRVTHYDEANHPIVGQKRVVVVATVPGSWAAAEGRIRPGDVVVSYDGIPVRTWMVLSNEASRNQSRAGTISVVLLRDGLPVVLDDAKPGLLGIYMEDYVEPEKAPLDDPTASGGL